MQQRSRNQRQERNRRQGRTLSMLSWHLPQSLRTRICQDRSWPSLRSQSHWSPHSSLWTARLMSTSPQLRPMLPPTWPSTPNCLNQQPHQNQKKENLNRQIRILPRTELSMEPTGRKNQSHLLQLNQQHRVNLQSKQPPHRTKRICALLKKASLCRIRMFR